MAQWLSTPDAAVLLCRCEEQVRRLARAGKIRSYRPEGTRKYYFKREDLDKYLEASLIPTINELVQAR